MDADEFYWHSSAFIGGSNCLRSVFVAPVEPSWFKSFPLDLDELAADGDGGEVVGEPGGGEGG